MTFYVVIDTNVLVSAMLKADSVPDSRALRYWNWFLTGLLYRF